MYIVQARFDVLAIIIFICECVAAFKKSRDIIISLVVLQLHRLCQSSPFHKLSGDNISYVITSLSKFSDIVDHA